MKIKTSACVNAQVYRHSQNVAFLPDVTPCPLTAMVTTKGEHIYTKLCANTKNKVSI